MTFIVAQNKAQSDAYRTTNNLRPKDAVYCSKADRLTGARKDQDRVVFVGDWHARRDIFDVIGVAHAAGLPMARD